jgi:hypothetical protein
MGVEADPAAPEVVAGELPSTIEMHLLLILPT